MSDTEKTHAEAIAGDIYNMICSARDSGLDLTQGFQNEPLSSPRLKLRYMFYTKKALASVPMPADVKRKLGHSNVLGMIEMNNKPYSIHLICALPISFAKIQSEAEILKAINEQGLQDYAQQLRQAMTEEFNQAEHEAKNTKLN